MSFSYEVLKNNTQRVSLVRFQRATMTPPEINYPDIDDRGCFRDEVVSMGAGLPDVKLSVDRGPIVGVTEGDTVFVEIERVRIANKAPLFITSSDEKAMKVSATAVTKISTTKYSSPSDKLFPWQTQTFQITGVKGSGGVFPNVAKVEVRYGSNKGPIIGELTVYVFTPFHINIVPHMVTLSGSKGYGVSHIFDVNPVFQLIKAIWQPCGIHFFVGATVDEFIPSNMNDAGKWKYIPGKDMEDMINQAKHHNSDAVNIYFVNEIDSGGNGVLAYARRPLKRQYKRCVIAQTNVPLIDKLAATIAHELGHFFDLDHTDNKDSSNEREDIWSDDRMLMHPTVSSFTFYPCLITMKDLIDKYNPTVNHITDPEWLTVRKMINSKDGPYK